ncbi:MAG TPA: hypothetical protein VKR31_18035 [Rhizomicrobium sp.]|nr:hypothetical protein [Rhizomicrobium sp.]
MDDFLNTRTSAFFWWCLPLAIGFATGLLGNHPTLVAMVWCACLAWMGAGCVLNAVRCRRLHCYIAGPVFILGAIAEGLVSTGMRIFGSHAVSNIAGATLILALLSFIPEMLWGRYAGR